MPEFHKTAREIEEAGKAPLIDANGRPESEYARQMRLLAERNRAQGLVYDPARDEWKNPAVMPPLDDGGGSTNNAVRRNRV